MNVQILEQVEKTTKKAPKDALLAQLDEQAQRIVKRTLDPDITYGITVDEDGPFKWHDGATHRDLQKFWDGLEGLLGSLASRDLTGNAAQAEMAQLLIHAPSKLDHKWACRILNKNLRAGFDIKTFNRVFGEGSVEKFTVQLAATYEPDKHKLSGRWHFQPKLDGNRVILLDGEAFSRNGKVYPAARDKVKEILAQDPKFFEKWVVDGEMMGDLGFDQSSGALRRLSDDGRQKAEFTYWAFDLVHRKEWERRRTVELAQRTLDLATFIGGRRLKHIRVVPTEIVDNPTHAQIMAICERHLANGFEGAMAKDARASYKWGRGDNLLKVKKFYDADLKVVGFYEGRGQHKGNLGGVVVEGIASDSKRSGVFVRSEVGSGFSHVFDPKNPTAVLRQDVWNNQKKWLGAVVQVQFQEITPKDSLRFPVFIMRRKDKE